MISSLRTVLFFLRASSDCERKSERGKCRVQSLCRGHAMHNLAQKELMMAIVAMSKASPKDRVDEAVGGDVVVVVIPGGVGVAPPGAATALCL